jgi:hypothetical protein
MGASAADGPAVPSGDAIQLLLHHGPGHELVPDDARIERSRTHTIRLCLPSHACSRQRSDYGSEGWGSNPFGRTTQILP